MFERSKALIELKKIQTALAKEIIEVETGNGAVVVRMNGEQKMQKITIDPEILKDVDAAKLEKWIESAITQAINQSQQVAAEKMKAISGSLGIPGL
jgi:DNA-binding YbaB/EbfC family protein